LETKVSSIASLPTVLKSHAGYLIPTFRVAFKPSKLGDILIHRECCSGNYFKAALNQPETVVRPTVQPQQTINADLLQQQSAAAGAQCCVLWLAASQCLQATLQQQNRDLSRCA
jgi:hypothetical protein